MPTEWLADFLNELEETQLPAEEARVLIVEDDDPLLGWLMRQLSEQPLNVRGSGSIAEAEALLQSFAPRVVIVDKNLPDGSGLELIRRGRARSPQTEFIVVTGDASLETAIEAINLGAFGYITKPFSSVEEIARKVRAALERRRVLDLNLRLAERLRSAEHELERTRLEIEMIDEVVTESRQHTRNELRRIIEELLEPLSVVEADVSSFTAFAAAAAKGEPVAPQAMAELGRLKMLVQLVRRLYAQTEDAADQLAGHLPSRLRET